MNSKNPIVHQLQQKATYYGTIYYDNPIKCISNRILYIFEIKKFIPAQGPLLQGIVISVSPVQFRPPFVALREIDLKPVVVPLPPHDIVQGSHSLQWLQMQSTGPKSTLGKCEIQFVAVIYLSFILFCFNVN